MYLLCCVHPHCRASPHCHACPPCAPPFPIRASRSCARLLCCACPSFLCAPHVCALFTRVRLYHMRLPTISSTKFVVHSTTWAFGPSTTERWLTVGCLGGDHLFYIHSHGHARGCGCMHIRFHVIFLFIVNASQLGGHIKLLALLYIL
jgi:hypothetical protein